MVAVLLLVDDDGESGEGTEGRPVTVSCISLLFMAYEMATFVQQ